MTQIKHRQRQASGAPLHFPGQQAKVFRPTITALAASLARQARQSVDHAPRAAGIAAKRYEAVAKAVSNLDRNASAPLTMIAMIQDMREALG